MLNIVIVGDGIHNDSVITKYYRDELKHSVNAYDNPIDATEKIAKDRSIDLLIVSNDMPWLLKSNGAYFVANSRLFLGQDAVIAGFGNYSDTERKELDVFMGIIPKLEESYDKILQVYNLRKDKAPLLQ